MKKTTPFLFGAALLALGAGGCVNRDAQDQAKRQQKAATDLTVPVEVGHPSLRSIAEVIEVSGQMVTSEEVAVSANSSGRLVSVLVRNGDLVSAGQVIARQDTSQLNARVRQALAGLSSARAQLMQALKDAEVGPRRTSAAVRAAEAQLAQARTALKKLRAGDRSEQRRQVAAQVQAARTAMENSKRTLERYRNLFRDGAVSRAEVEQVETSYAQTLSAYEQALEVQRMQQTGARPEDIAIAEDQVRAATEALAQARASQQLDPQLQMRVESARATVASAEESVSLARIGLEDAVVRAPISGQISGQPVQAGTVLGPGAMVAKIVGRGGTYFEGDVPETKLEQVRVGSLVSVRLDAIEGKTYMAKIQSLSPSASSVGRVFKARISLLATSPELKPGMFARGEIEVRSVADALVLPKSVILEDSEGKYVMLKEGDKAVRKSVNTGITHKNNVQVLGLEPTADVIVVGHDGLPNGAKIKVLTGAKSN